MVQPKVSIIIPVYNVEKYIIECLQSVENQSYSNYEAILIDDGSTDNSAGIIRDYIEGKEKFILLEKENGGVSSARNCGIAQASGQWITFIDSDDFVDDDFISEMVNGLINCPADFCMTGFKKHFEETKETRDSLVTTFAYGTLENVLDSLFFPSPFARLYSTEVIKQNNIFFDERISCGEDRAFNFDYFCHTEKCLVLESKKYFYRIRKGSVTGTDVLPSKKKHLFEHVQRFWNAFSDESVITEAFERNHHLAHNIVDSFLAEAINLVLDHDDDGYKRLIADPVSQCILNHYGHKNASKKEKLLIGLLKSNQLYLTKIIIKLYYSSSLHTILKSFVKQHTKASR